MFYAFHFDVEDAYALLGGDVAYGLNAGAVEVAAEFGVYYQPSINQMSIFLGRVGSERLTFDKPILADEFQKVLFCGEVVFPSIFFAGSGGASSIFST